MAADTKRGALVFGHDESSHYSVPMTDVVKALAAQGLAVVTKAEADELADLRGRAERAEAWLTRYDGKTHVAEALEALRGR